ncbi:MAG: HAD family hydrolase [Anaerolineae bacterium]
MRYDALIWDFDGTICDTTPAFVRAMQEALRDQEIEARADTIEPLIRETLGTAVNTFAARHGLDADRLHEAWAAHYRAISPAEQPPFPGVESLLRRFQDAGGRSFLFTHRSRASLIAHLDHYGLTEYFVELLAVDDGYARKPDPQAFHDLMSRYNLAPARVLAIGDRPLDIQAGQAAGVATCLYGMLPPPTLGPDYAIMDYAALERSIFA